MNPNLVWNIEQGLQLSPRQIGNAEKLRTTIYSRVCKFFEQFDLLLTPTVAVSPFPIEIPYPTEINGKSMTNYIDWLLLTYAMSIVGLPALSIPCGWTRDGLPVGIQIVGPRLSEAIILKAATAFEMLAPWKGRQPSFHRNS
jgi:amidase